jgi:hypothetical protein
MHNLNKTQADEIYIAGQHMSNWMYNVSQRPEFTKYAESMQEMVRDWDAVSKQLVKKRVLRGK